MWGPIQMTPAEAGWWVDDDDEAYPVVAWAILRNFADQRAPNIFAPVAVIDGELAEVLDGQLRYEPQRLMVAS
jgi:hypothetical protein